MSSTATSTRINTPTSSIASNTPPETLAQENKAQENKAQENKTQENKAQENKTQETPTNEPQETEPKYFAPRLTVPIVAQNGQVSQSTTYYRAVCSECRKLKWIDAAEPSVAKPPVEEEPYIFEWSY